MYTKNVKQIKNPINSAPITIYVVGGKLNVKKIDLTLRGGILAIFPLKVISLEKGSGELFRTFNEC